MCGGLKMTVNMDADIYNERKVNKILRKYKHELTFSAYCELNELGFKDAEIRQWFGVYYQAFNYFKQRHIDVLGEGKLRRLGKGRNG